MSNYIHEWDEEKNALLKDKFRICFEDVLIALQSGKLLSEEPHFNQKDYPHQKIYIVEINEYAYVVPFVIHNAKQSYFLKTIYPSRKHTKLFLTDRHND
ncbi:MAG: hypothetical protein ACI89S_001422 [Gammaproteobacteria bacterium]|jgi:hypothetical protein